MRRLLAIAATVLAAACAEPTDILYTQPLVTAVEVQPGLFQVTTDPNPDQVRGFTATGDTILFRGLRHSATGDHWEILGMPAAGGLGFIEHAAIYRLALRQDLGTLLSRAQDRVLTWWQAGNGGDFFGPAGCPHTRRLAVWTVALIRLQPADGAALSSLPEREFITPTVTTTGGSSPTFTVRFTPAEVEADQGANAFGPAFGSSATLGVYSDGDTTWRFDPATPSTPADNLGRGIFPSVSADGALLAVAVPQIADSTTATESYSAGLATCTQKEISYTVAQTTTVVTRLATGDTVLKVDGTEPVFDPAGGRVLVRRATGLVWVDLTSKAATLLPSTAGAFAVAVSPSGQYVAFSKLVGKNVDVYYVKLQ